MKIIYTLLLLSFSGFLFSQGIVNKFEVKNGAIVWVNVFDSQLSFNQLSKAINESGLIDELNIKDDQISGSLKLMVMDYQGKGYSTMSAPMYVSQFDFKGFIIIDYKEGRYRVKIKNIKAVQNVNNGISQIGTTKTLENFALKKGLFHKRFNKSSGIMDYTFMKLFHFDLVEDDNF